MRDLAADLGHKHGVEVVVETIDLAEPNGAAALERRLDARGIEPTILVNNAGFGLSSAFVDHEPDDLRAMLQVDVVALTELTHLFGRRMAARGNGFMLLVASVAAYQPTPILAAYGAAKAYVLSLGQSLNVELAPRVGVTVLCPGLMDTEFFEVAGYRPPAALRTMMLSPAEVARIGLDAMFAHKPNVVAGRLNKAMTLASRILSRHLQAKAVFRMSRR